MMRMVFDSVSGEAVPVEDSLADRKALRYRETAAEQPTRRVMLRMGGAVMEVDIPTVEARFLVNFREPSTDAPGLVQTDDGLVYLVAPDGTRSLLGTGGGSGLPPQWTTDDATGAVTGAGTGTAPVLSLRGGSDGDGEVLEVLFPNGTLALVVSDDSGFLARGRAGDVDHESGGNAGIEGGSAFSGDGSGGSVRVGGGVARGGGSGGNITILGGEADSLNGAGGDILIQAGGGDAPGTVELRDGNNRTVLVAGGGTAFIGTTDPSSQVSFFGVGPTGQQEGVAVDVAAIHAALVTLGLITA